MSATFLNGAFVEPEDARIGAFDAGLQHGVGLFETLLGVRTGPDSLLVIHLSEHLSRLADSAAALGLSSKVNTGALGEAVEQAAARAAANSPTVNRFRIRLTITGGDMSMLNAAQGAGHTPTLLIHVQPSAGYPQEMFQRGIMASIADWRANPLDSFQGHKTLWYWPRLRELQLAAAKRAGEAIVLQVTNYVAGGCVSNLFLVRGQCLITPIARGEEEDALGDSLATANISTEGQATNNYDPPVRGAAVPSPVLPGVVRRWVMDWALSRGIPCERKMVTISDVLDADELFLTNSAWGVLPVVAVETKQIGSGKVGDLTRDLLAAWQALEQP